MTGGSGTRRIAVCGGSAVRSALEVGLAAAGGRPWELEIVAAADLERPEELALRFDALVLDLATLPDRRVIVRLSSSLTPVLVIDELPDSASVAAAVSAGAAEFLPRVALHTTLVGARIAWTLDRRWVPRLSPVRLPADGTPAGAWTDAELLAALDQAADRGELRLALQPLYGLQAGVLHGFEALLRWTREGVPVPTERVIRLAEAHGRIQSLGAWVIDEAARLAFQLRGVAGGHAPIAVNLSAQQFHDPELTARIDAAMARHDLPAGALSWEVTETSVMSDPRAASRVLTELRERGMRVAIDDFGTGFSSLAQLQRLPLDTLKIDRAFIRDVQRDIGARVITRAIVSIARALGLDVTAEGVEDDAQLNFVAKIGCTAAQGYLLGRPMDAERAERIWSQSGSTISTEVADLDALRALVLGDRTPDEAVTMRVDVIPD